MLMAPSSLLLEHDFSLEEKVVVFSMEEGSMGVDGSNVALF